MKPDLYAALKRDFPEQFATIRGPCECGDGWEAIIRRVCEAAANRAPVQWSCIKEKFGTLRMYATGEGEFSQALIDAYVEAERQSAQTCERCGKPGELRNISGWLSTRCDEHNDRPAL